MCGGHVVQRDDDTEEAVATPARGLRPPDRADHRLLPEPREAGRGRRRRRAATSVQERLIKEIDGRFDPAPVVITRKNPDQIALMRRAGRVVAEMHEVCIRAAKPGATTLDVDAAAREVIDRRGARSNFLGYHGFPAVVCTSPNDVIVHGIPSDDVVLAGRRHPLDRLRGDHRGLARRRRGHRARRRRRRRVEAAHRGHPAVAGGRDRPGGRGQPARRRRRRGRGHRRACRIHRGAGVRRPRHRHRHARGAAGAELRARRAGA